MKQFVVTKGAHAVRNKNHISAKHQRFVDEYLIDLNASAAYLRAGYAARGRNVAAVNACRLLRNAKVQAYLAHRQAELLDKTGTLHERVLAEIRAFAFATVTDVVTWGPDGIWLKPPSEIKPQSLNAVENLRLGDGRRVTSISMRDPTKALILLGKQLGMFK